MNPKIKHYILNSPRIILGLTFIISGVGKLLDRENAKYLVELMASEIYVLIEWQNEIVFAIITVELLFALFLLLGKQLIKTYIFSFLFVGTLTGVISYFMMEGFSVDSCGCFGAFGFSGGLETTLIRNIVLMLIIIAGFLISWSKQRNEKNLSGI